MIFCVEDDKAVRELVLYTLKASGFEAAGFENAAEFWEGMRGARPDLILLDIMLPDEDGIAILTRLRRQAATRDVPVIMATAKGTEFDTIVGLDSGADDYLAKPFGMMEMVSRIRAVLRRAAPGTADILRYGSMEMCRSGRQVTVSGRRLELTLKEYELLHLFLCNPGTVFSRDQLLSAVWGNSHACETRTVDVHIATLRTKLGGAGGHIRTVRGVGYRLEEDA